MSTDARAALSRLVAALEHHYDMACNADVVKPSMLEDAEARLQDAFFTYDDTLFTSFGIELPLELVEDYDDEEGEDDADDTFDVVDIDDTFGIIGIDPEDDGGSVADIFDAD